MSGGYVVWLYRSHPQHAPEAPGGVVRFRPIVVDEDVAVAAITKERATERSDLGGCLHPTRRLCVEFPECLQGAVLVFRQEFDAYGCRHIERVICGWV